MQENIKLFLENILIINKKYELLDSKNSEFNIFTILRNESDEVNLHSKFISELLKNKKYGNMFFKLLLENFEIQIDTNTIEKESFEVFLEYYCTLDSRIDILIKINTEKLKKVLIIENKIYAEDQEKQLERYYEGIKNMGYRDQEIEIIYLTLDGTSPSESSLGKLNKENNGIIINNISYKNNIIEWINKCCKEVVLVPIIRETLFQYKNLLERLTMKESEEKMEELKKAVLKNEEYLKVAYSIPDVLIEIKVEAQLKFWKLIEKEMEKLEIEYGLKKCKDSKINPNYDDNSEYIKKYYIPNSKKVYYGIMYLIKEENDEKVYLRIELGDCPYWGIVLVGNDNKKIRLKEIMEKLNFGLQWVWPFKYLGDKNINLKKCNFELVKILNNEEKSEEFIKKIVNKIKQEYDELQEYINLKEL